MANGTAAPIVIVGGKNNKKVANYQAACVEEFSRGAMEVVLRARGKAIGLAVDTAQKMGRLPGYACDMQAVVGTEPVGAKADRVSFIELLVRRTS